MSDPSQPDDDWAELARELERDKPSVEPAPGDDEQPTEDAPADFAESDETGGAYEDDDSGEGDEAGAEGDGTSGDGPPGTGRKRRRRRRRRRKGGQPADATAEAPATNADEASPAAAAIEDDTDAGDGYADEEADEEEPATIASEVEAAEDAGGELLRDLIANWNVPSWEEIVGGLHRP